MKIDGVEVAFKGIEDISEEEKYKYISYVKERVKGNLRSLELTFFDDGTVDIEYEVYEKFERIRRITGYLTGSLDSWNNAKQSEEQDRVKHDLPKEY